MTYRQRLQIELRRAEVQQSSVAMIKTQKQRGTDDAHKNKSAFSYYKYTQHASNTLDAQNL